MRIRSVGIGLLSILLVAMGIAVAAPVQASSITTIALNTVATPCSSGTFTQVGTIDVAPGDTIVFSNIPAACVRGLVTGNIVTTGADVSASASSPISGVQNGSTDWIFEASPSAALTRFEVTITRGRTGYISLRDSAGVSVSSWTVRVSGGTPSPASSASPPIEVQLSLDLAASGASCKEGTNSAGVFGSWLTLPGAGDCSSTTTPSARLLGWSTSVNFPIAVAQSQVDKGWGTIDDTFDGFRMIFIPAGQATFVSGPNSLHPIWAN